MKFRKLFAPCKVGTMELENRIIMPPISTEFARDGFVTDRMKDYYVERAKGGASLIIVEDAIVDSPVGYNTISPLRVDDDRFLPGLKDLAEAIKAQGPKVCLQLSHAGRRAVVPLTNGPLIETQRRLPVAPSSIAHPRQGYVVPRELTVEEIDEIIERFAKSARRARDAGFDAISLHCTHGYLINEFLSPLSNKRHDEYGGDFDGRLRFVFEIIQRTKQRVGSDHPLLCRIGPEIVEGGLQLEDTQKIAQRMEELGIDAINVSVGGASTRMIPPIAPMRLPRGCIVHFAEAVKKTVSIPVGTANRINDPQLAEKILEEGKADLIAMGRPLIADPELPKKAFEGKLDDIRPCIACCDCAYIGGELGKPIECAVNAALGQEEELRISVTSKRKRILIVGGGPAGMEAARVAALRGHEVLLYEQRNEPGGQLLLAVVPPGKGEIMNLVSYLVGQIKKLGVKIELGKKATLDSVQKLKPDVVILATGSRALIPQIPGMNKEHVVTANEVLEGKAEIKEEVVVLGGGQMGTETAEYLTQKGRKVTIIEMLGDIASDMFGQARVLLLLSLQDKGVQVLTKTKAEEVTDFGVIVIRKRERQTIKADTIVLAVGAEPNTELAEKLKNKVPELYCIGDCFEPRRILDAIHEGFKTAISV